MRAETRRLYFDHNASAPLLPEARAAAMDALAGSANPSSVHAEGRRARAILGAARRDVAALAGTDAEGVVFTSGATEAANTLLSPVWQRGGETVRVERLAVIETDHPCLLEGGRFGPHAPTRLAVDRDGGLRIDALQDWLDRPGEGTSLLAISLANNESGVIQPLAPIREALCGRDALFVVDAVQAAGRLPLDMAEIGADALILSGHKIGALQGAGAIVLRDAGTVPAPLLVGGGQELRLRAGTQAVPAVASFGAAARIAFGRTTADRERLRALRARLERRLAEAGAVVIIGAGTERLANTLLVSAAGLRAETAQIALDLQGFAVSSGSACASGKVGASPVLAAHARAGFPVDPAAGAIRISFGFETTADEIDAMGEAFAGLVERAALAPPAARVA